ncbi:LysR family transcriptional regulator [Paenibacillus paeoniae]|uniref:LysR family transcriptional regulator n=1 Tax=Paenibacillus paeoniae TaxID=2292705 RepID=A0A371P8M0_9BACL|nr:LysR family transcriptional regulator [Paenibacillus paeoniae]REK71840.1 LysR family transcriptional regulator [Paenibacillus paeoniae]
MVNLELYRVFYYTAKAGSISKAAQQLHMAQPSASLAIKQLEDSLQTNLFHRTPRGVSLTSEGQTLFAYIEQAYELIMSAESKLDEVANLGGGEIRIAASVSVIQYVLMPHLERFHRQYPTINIKLSPGSTRACLKMLKEGKIDFCIVRLPIEDESLTTTSLLSIQDCFVAGEKYRHLSESPISLKELAAKYPLVVFPPHMTSRQAMDQLMASFGVTLTPKYEIGSLHVLIGLAQANLGLSYVVKEFVKKELEEGSLLEVKVKESIPRIDFGIVRMKHLAIPVAAQQFINEMLDEAGVKFA